MIVSRNRRANLLVVGAAVLMLRRRSGSRVSYKSIAQECPTRVSQNNAPQELPTRVTHKSVLQVSHKSVPQECPIRVSHKSFLQECPTRVSYKSVLQECHLVICIAFRTCLHSGSLAPSCFSLNAFSAGWQLEQRREDECISS